MAQTAVEARRLVGKVVLFLAFCWVIVLIAGVSGAVQGASFELTNVALALIPGCAFIPAGYYAIRLHRTTDAALVAKLWVKALAFGILGLGLLIGAAYLV